MGLPADPFRQLRPQPSVRLPADQDADMPEANAGLAGVVELLGAGEQGQGCPGWDEPALGIDRNRDRQARETCWQGWASADPQRPLGEGIGAVELLRNLFEQASGQGDLVQSPAADQ